jgi:D-alanyl-D-alanine carboxypeptidase
LIATEPLLTEPGTRWSYSNTGYFLLGMLIEKLSGRSYASYLDEEIFQPLGMSSTGYDSAARILPERASGYVRRPNGELLNAEYINMSVPFASGGLYSTGIDLLIWNTALHNSRILNPESYQRMVSRFPEAHGDDWFYGYGIFITEKFGVRCLSHDGGVNGFIAVLQYYPERQASLIVLSNLMDPVAIRSVVERIAGMLIGPSATS